MHSPRMLSKVIEALMKVPLHKDAETADHMPEGHGPEGHGGSVPSMVDESETGLVDGIPKAPKRMPAGSPMKGLANAKGPSDEENLGDPAGMLGAGTESGGDDEGDEGHKESGGVSGAGSSPTKTHTSTSTTGNKTKTGGSNPGGASTGGAGTVTITTGKVAPKEININGVGGKTDSQNAGGMDPSDTDDELADDEGHPGMEKHYKPPGKSKYHNPFSKKR